MSVENGLKTFSVPQDLNLSELEKNLIAKVIPFQKVFKLPTSRMAAVKDKIVNIPIHEKHILSTFQSLPKTPQEGGLIEVKLKRKQEYKTAHNQAFISPERLFKAMNYLKKMGNPHHQFFGMFTIMKLDAKGQTQKVMVCCLLKLKNPVLRGNLVK